MLVALMRERPLEPACFCLALERLNTQVQACPDPEAWAAQITRSPDFQPVLGRLHRLLPQFDAAQLSQVTRRHCHCHHTTGCHGHHTTTQAHPPRPSRRRSSRSPPSAAPSPVSSRRSAT